MATNSKNPQDACDERKVIGMVPEEECLDKPTYDKTSGLPILSRRAMLEGVVASTLAAAGMMLLPKENDGVLFAGFNPLGAERAYAATNNVWSGSFSFTVVGADQVGFQILDVSGLADLDESEIEKNGKPVEDATVTLTSLYNDETVSDQTNEEGKVILPIAALAFSTAGTDGVFRANCKLSVTTKDARVKMRDFSTGRVCLEGSTAFIIGTHKTDDDDVYMERCTFDDWDIHYSKLTFLRSEVNEDKHTIEVCIKGAQSNVDVSMEVLDAKDKKTAVIKKRSTTASYDSKSALATCAFEGYFLNARHNARHEDCITKDDVIIRITLTSGKKSYVSDLEMLIEDTPYDEATLGKPILPLTTDPKALFSFKAETDEWPVFNGIGFTVLDVVPPVQVSTTIATATVGIGTDARMVADKGGWAPKDNWKKDHKGNMFTRFANEFDRKYSELEKRTDANKEIEMEEIHAPGDEEDVMPQAKPKVLPFFNGEINLIFRLALMVQWDGFDNDLDKFTGKGTVEIGFSASGTFTFEFMAGPLPMFLSITFGMTALGCFSVVSTYTKRRTVKEIDFAEMGWNVNMSAGLLLKFLFAVSLGIGYKGLASFSFDASFSLPVYLGWKEEGSKEDTDPHTTVGATFLLEVVVQALLFKLSGQIYSYQNNNWYDSWSKDEVTDALTGDDAWEGLPPRFRLTQRDGTFRHSLIYDNEGNLFTGNGDDPFADAVPTTDAMMMGSREADARKSSGNDVSALTDEEFQSFNAEHSAHFVAVEGATGVFKREAGTAGVDTPTYVFVGKMPKAVVQDDGTIGTELVDCEGVNTFYFGEMTPDATASAANEDTDASAASADEKSTDADAAAATAESTDADAAATEEIADIDAAAATAESPNVDASAAASAESTGVDPAAVTAESTGTTTTVTEGIAGVDAAAATEGIAGVDAAAVVAESTGVDAAAASAESPNVDAAAVVAGSTDAGTSNTPTMAETAKQDNPRFEGDPLLGFALGVTQEFEYDIVPGKTTGEPCGPSGVLGIGLHDGVVPQVDTIIYKDVHSDPRQRVVTIGGALYLFRVVTVKYPIDGENSYCRTRVAGLKFDDATQTWGNPKVLEYSTGNRDLPRVKIYDYEFDIVVRSGSKRWTQDAEACLIVTGGLRPSGDDTLFHDAASQCTVAILAIDADLEVLQCSVRGVSANDTTAAKLAFNEEEEHLVCSPCIVDGFAADGASGSLAYAFLRRSAGSTLGLTTTEASVTFCVGHCYVRDGYLSFPQDLKEDSSIALAADVYGMKGVAGNAVAKEYDALLTLLVNHQNGYDVCTATIPPGGDFSQLKITHCIESGDSLPEIQPWPQHGTFLYVKPRPVTLNSSDTDYNLYQGTFDPLTSGQTSFGAEQVDTAGIKGASFCVSPNGDFIFYYESYRDKKDSNPKATFTSNTVTDTGDDSIRHIMASRLMDGKFCEDFPFCELDHPADRIEVLNLDGDASSFVVTHITDANESLADIHYISVPNVLSVEVEAFVQTTAFVCAGNKAPFSMDIRNHGNLIVSGFDVQVIDYDDHDKVVGTVHVGEIDPSKIALTAAHMGWGPTASETPQLSAEEEQGMLMPGKKMSYPAEFMIPDDWEGKKTVILRIVNATTPPMSISGLQAQAETDAAAGFAEEENGFVIRGIADSIHHYHVGKQGDVSVVGNVQGDGTVYDPAEWVIDESASDDPSNPNGQGGGPSGASGGTSGGTAGKIPGTGDGLRPLGPLALAAAGAAALAAGYSARRMKIEREAQESKEGEES